MCPQHSAGCRLRLPAIQRGVGMLKGVADVLVAVLIRYSTLGQCFRSRVGAAWLSERSGGCDYVNGRLVEVDRIFEVAAGQLGPFPAERCYLEAGYRDTNAHVLWCYALAHRMRRAWHWQHYAATRQSTRRSHCQGLRRGARRRCAPGGGVPCHAGFWFFLCFSVCLAGVPAGHCMIGHL